jgi:hypothetical protein
MSYVGKNISYINVWILNQDWPSNTGSRPLQPDWGEIGRKGGNTGYKDLAQAKLLSSQLTHLLPVENLTRDLSFLILNSHWFGASRLLSSPFCRCDWLQSLKCPYITGVFSLTYHFNMHLEKFYGPENRENMFL